MSNQPLKVEISPCGPESEEPAPSSSQLKIADGTVEKGKQVKQKRTKVKTGCFTCRVRRVKCDEGKPHCHRCIKFGVDCDGYPPSSKASRDVSVPARAIAPKYRRFIPKIFNPDPQSPISSEPALEDEHEATCFRIYCDEMAPQIRGPSKTALWEQLIPQISEGEPCIRHFLIAIGALSKFNRPTVKDPFRPDSEDSIGTLTFEYVLKQYDKGLNGMRKYMEAREQALTISSETLQIDALRKMLIACVLVFCFETLLGKPGTASINAESGLMLFHQSALHLGNESRSFCELMFRTPEEGLMAAFSGLDLQVLFFADNRPHHVHDYIVTFANKEMAKLPLEIGDISAASHFWSVILRRNYHFVKSVLLYSKCEEMAYYPHTTNGEPWDDAANMVPGGNMFSTPKQPPMERFSASTLYRKQTALLSQACMKLYTTVEQNGTTKEKIIIALLRISELMSQIMLAGAFFTTETAYDTFLPQFKVILSLAEYVHPHLTAGTMTSPYQFDLSISHALYLVGSRCRDQVTRQKALDLVMKCHYREGNWDSTATATLLCWIRDIEDEQREENGYLPEHGRAFLTCAYIDLTGRKMLLRATRRGLEGLVFVEKLFTW